MIPIFRANKEASQPSRRQIIRRAAPPQCHILHIFVFHVRFLKIPKTRRRQILLLNNIVKLTDGSLKYAFFHLNMDVVLYDSQVI